MFLIPDKKIAVIWNPRTGSMSHHELLWGRFREHVFQPDDDLWRATGHSNDENHYHSSLGAMWIHYGKWFNLDEFRVFAFYREPVSWFLSCVKYLTRTSPQYGYHINMSPRAFMERTEWGVGQYPFVSGATDLFNFHDFENETVRMFSEMGIAIEPKDIPRVNAEPSDIEREPLSERELEQLRTYFSRDFDFFDSKGITFPKYANNG